jgi:hypothetical protein
MNNAEAEKPMNHITLNYHNLVSILSQV